MDTHVVAIGALIVILGAGILMRFGPELWLDAVDYVVLHLPARFFLAMSPVRGLRAKTMVMAAAIVCGFGLILSFSRQTGLWIVWPAAALVLVLAVGFGVAFATMVWPVVLTAGFVVLWLALGVLERAGGERVPFPDDGPRVSALNVTIVLTALLSGYASAMAVQARDAISRRPIERPRRWR